jgi:anti-anti-sigma regulatory factor
MLRIRRSANEQVIFTLSGRIDREDIAELEQVIRSEESGGPIVFDLGDVTLVDHDAIDFLNRCEGDLITLMNCPAYIREWITRQRTET